MPTFHQLISPGYLLETLDAPTLEGLEQAKQRACGQPQLASWIQGTSDHWPIDIDPKLSQQIINLGQQYLDRWPIAEVYWLPRHKPQLVMGNTWLNRQGRGQFTPTHTHDCLLSWVIWLATPWLAKEIAYPHGDFYFHWTDTLGRRQQEPMQVDLARNGTLCLFPAQLEHSVHPQLKLDRERWSISGNLHIEL